MLTTRGDATAREDLVMARSSSEMMKQAVILPPAETDRRRNFPGSKQTADEASAHFAQDASASADGFTLSWSKVQSRLRRVGKGLHEFGEITMQRLSGFRLQKNFLSIAKGQTPKSIPLRLVKPAVAYRNLLPRIGFRRWVWRTDRQADCRELLARRFRWKDAADHGINLSPGGSLRGYLLPMGSFVG